MKLSEFISEEGYNKIDELCIIFHSLFEDRTISKLRDVHEFPDFKKIRDMEYERISLYKMPTDTGYLMSLTIEMDVCKSDGISINDYLSGICGTSDIQDIINIEEILYSDKFAAIEIICRQDNKAKGRRMTICANFDELENESTKALTRRIMEIINSIDPGMWSDPNFVIDIDIYDHPRRAKKKWLRLTVRAYMSEDLMRELDELQEDIANENY